MNINRNSIIISVIISLFFAATLAQEHPGFRVIGRHLYDKCGERVILRGINNPNIWFHRNGLPEFTEIEKTGANVIRIVWNSSGTASQLDAAITNCIGLGMIPMVESHDATGDWSMLDDVVDYWTRADIAEVLIEHEEYLLINIANECGAWGVPEATFTAGYKDAITAFRNAGIHVPLVIDGTDWGKDIDILQSQGPALIQYDPDNNLMFSVHMWWPQMYGYSVADIGNEIVESKNMDLPLIVGEFSQMHGECDDDVITPQNSISYLTIIEKCHLNQTGYIAWSFYGNCNPFWDMSTSGTYATLYDWGLEVGVTDQYSIQNTSVRPYYIVNGVCNPEAIEDNTEITAPNGFLLKQNLPNPFSSGTEISYEVFVPAKIILEIFDINGWKIRTLVNDPRTIGTYSAYWDGLNDHGNIIQNGFYFCRIRVIRDNDEFTKVNKLVLIR